jgi:hypothetical protein
MKITKELLIKNDACRGQVDLFCSVFPNGTRVTLATLQKARKNNLDIFWLEKVIPDSAWAKYNEVCNSAWAKYNEVNDSAWAKYNEVNDSAWAKYNEVCDSALVKAFS